MRRALATAVVLGCIVVGLAGCEQGSTVSRPGEAVVMTGAQLPSLRGTAPGRIVAFRHTVNDDRPAWTQVPVQVDQRKVVPFGSQPPNGTNPGTVGTVYGHGTGGPTALQYADPNTFVGADADATFDTDDELVFMVSDAGGKPRADDPVRPPGVVAGSGVAVRIDDPQNASHVGWVHLFVSTGGLVPSAGKDYVGYDFVLTSGAYKTTYDRATGPNPETSRVETAAYRIGFSDRWYEDEWRVRAGNASEVDILDGNKNQFAVGNCGRSNATFAAAEGAFVANIDGPVRAIRSYVGANSGPLTQRTHYMYLDREVVVTDLRVHAIPAVMDYLDYSAAASTMVYRSSTTSTSGVRIDGAADTVSTTPPEWEAVNGPQGTVVTAIGLATDVTGLENELTWFYRDARTTSEQQCWGDTSYYGASGSNLDGAIPNTDPRASGAKTVRVTRTNHFVAPVTNADLLVAVADALADDIARPVTVTPSRYPA